MKANPCPECGATRPKFRLMGSTPGLDTCGMRITRTTCRCGWTMKTADSGNLTMRQRIWHAVYDWNSWSQPLLDGGVKPSQVL